MKHGRHDSEYDRVRRGAGYDRPKLEFPDEKDEIDLQARIDAGLSDFRKRMADLEQQDAERSAQMARRAAESSAEINRRMILRDYERQGLQRPEGTLVSLPLLMKLGWRIEEIDGKNVLVKPNQQKQRKTREDYERERSINAEGS